MQVEREIFPVWGINRKWGDGGWGVGEGNGGGVMAKYLYRVPAYRPKKGGGAKPGIFVKANSQKYTKR